MHKVYLFSTSSPALAISCLLFEDILVVVISQCSCDSQFTNDLILNIFSGGHWYIFSRKMPTQVLCPFLNQIVGDFILDCMSFLNVF